MGVVTHIPSQTNLTNNNYSCNNNVIIPLLSKFAMNKLLKGHAGIHLNLSDFKWWCNWNAMLKNKTADQLLVVDINSLTSDF